MSSLAQMVKNGLINIFKNIQGCILWHGAIMDQQDQQQRNIAMGLIEYLDASMIPWQPRKNQLSEAETESLRQNMQNLIEWGAVVAMIEIKIMGMMSDANN